MDHDDGRWMMMMMMKKVEQIKERTFQNLLGMVWGPSGAYEWPSKNSIATKLAKKVEIVFCGNLMVWLRIDLH